MLRWSAEITGRPVDLGSIADPARDSGIIGGSSLAKLARAATRITSPNSEAVEQVAEELGAEAASEAAAVATAFEGLNRIVDGTGLPIGRAQRRDGGDLITELNLDSFPHASHGA